MSEKILFLSRADVENLLSMDQAIECMKDAFSQLSAREAVVPRRMHMEIVDRKARFLFMPVYLPRNSVTGLKTVSIYHDNPANGLPLIHGMMMVMDGKNGKPLALLDAEYLTAMRTGAASGLATDLLARKNSEALAIFGTGGQAQKQVEAVIAVRPIKKILVFGRKRSNTEKFAEEIRRRHKIDVETGSSPGQLTMADIVCTATTSSEPVFSNENLKPGVHINGMGSYLAIAREIPSATVKRSKVVVDQREAAWSEAGDLVIPLQEGIIDKNHVYAELGEIVSGMLPGRVSESEMTLFKSVGNAAQDLVAASFVIAEAERKNAGTRVSF